MIYIKKSVLCFVNNSKNGENISLFHNYFKKRTEIHQINTRNRNNLVVTRSKIEMGKKNVHNFGASQWNNLPNKFKTSKSIHIFKKAVNHWVGTNGVTGCYVMGTRNAVSPLRVFAARLCN